MGIMMPMRLLIYAAAGQPGGPVYGQTVAALLGADAHRADSFGATITGERLLAGMNSCTLHRHVGLA